MNEIILDSDGNTYVGDLAQPFATGRMKLPAIFAIDDACFHVFEVDGEKVIHRASQSTRALAQNYMSPDRILVYRRYQFEHTHEGLGVDCRYCGKPHYPAGCRVYKKADGTWTNKPGKNLSGAAKPVTESGESQRLLDGTAPNSTNSVNSEFQRRMARKQINNRRNASKNRKRDRAPQTPEQEAYQRQMEDGGPI